MSFPEHIDPEKITEDEYLQAKLIVRLYENKKAREDLLGDPNSMVGTPAQIFERKLFHEIFIKLRTMKIVKDKQELLAVMKERITNVQGKKAPDNPFFVGTFFLDQTIPLVDYDYETLTLSLR